MNDLDRLDLVRAADGHVAIDLPQGTSGDELKWLQVMVREYNHVARSLGLNAGLPLCWAVSNSAPSLGSLHESAEEMRLYPDSEAASRAADAVANWRRKCGLDNDDAPIDFTGADTREAQPEGSEAA